MELTAYNRTENALFVELDCEHILIDSSTERVVVLNDSAAWVWTRLGTAATVPASAEEAVARFIDALCERGLLSSTPCCNDACAEAGFLNGRPEILSEAPLEAAAGISSGDPWAYMGVGAGDIV